MSQLRNGTLPSKGIFYVKGGSRNTFGWRPRDRDPIVQANTLGDDDHPGVGDSDHQAGEAFVATFVNAIAHRIPSPMNCRALGITPASVPGANKTPRGFRSRPSNPHL